MREIHIVLLSIYLFSNLLSAQSKEDPESKFDSIYFDTAVNWAKKDYKKALKISDSLYNHSQSPLHKLKSLMLIASIYEQLGQQEQAIKYALRADKIAVKTSNYDWQAKTMGFLSSQYRNLGLLNEGRRVLNKGIQIIEKVGDVKRKNFYYGLVYQEMAYYEIEEGYYDKAKSFINQSTVYFGRLKESRNNFYYKATNQELFAKCELGLGNMDKAEQYLDQALIYLDQSSLSESVLRGLIFSGKARVFKSRKEYSEALNYFKKAEELAETSGFLGLKLEVYKELSDFFKETGEGEKQSLYREKFETLRQSNNKQSKSTVDGIFTGVNQDKEQLESQQYLYISIITLLFLCVLASIVFYKIKKKKDLIQFNYIFNELQDAKLKTKVIRDSSIQDQTLESISKDKITISKAWETKILKHLADFEYEQGYLDRNISASSLATKVDTNTKYLSVILKTHRNNDFNNYIGNLRVQYIISKMIDHPEYKNYKISYLAEECGFSTHSKFTAVFKKHAGITPSVFLENLKNQI